MHGSIHTLLPREDDDGGASHGRRALVVTAVLTAISILIVGMRLYARFGLMKIAGREDWAILVSLTFSIIYLALVAAQLHYKMGVHSALLSSHVLQQQLKCLWAAIPMYNASLAFSKFSILLQYLRIFPAKRFRLACYVMIAIVAAYSSWAIVSGFVDCVPVAKFWNKDLPGSCLSFEAVWFFNASMNIATDIALLVLPMPLLSKLQLPRMQKIALMGVFAMGLLVVVTSILRLSSLREVAKSPDTSYSNVAAAYWTAAECNVAIMCACLPFLRPIISRIFPKLLSGGSSNPYANKSAGTNLTGTRALTHHTQMFTYNHDKDYEMYSINVKLGDHSSHISLGGIEVTTEMSMSIMQEATPKNSTSEHKVVMDA
ncbi:hypothetical protein DTO013E5_509 [Penicillium roqueforti]|uniref:Genomic scaffold, ProqFM164S02 n=1 Tax=Penicillium roqueforti (strain FM164) TaxID=1365484 RepID=W6QMP0_PENRF|nr:hypothetical protein CBS147337_344 [Penicillium roqueforti]CDM30847.1 unnamed protein product [Penicillium roqueforti FM164]KAI2680478.1 hypothetical protein CBS147355_3458 [Penicillium roqueforti]KAI2691133.1 hypothetical protein LCP963914a_1334 [Penicillium roqueforti]KAI2706888.1 hypothetical protein CBS147372_799 [Penicillium roqueforti]